MTVWPEGRHDTQFSNQLLVCGGQNKRVNTKPSFHSYECASTSHRINTFWSLSSGSLLVPGNHSPTSSISKESFCCVIMFLMNGIVRGAQGSLSPVDAWALLSSLLLSDSQWLGTLTSQPKSDPVTPDFGSSLSSRLRVSLLPSLSILWLMLLSASSESLSVSTLSVIVDELPETSSVTVASVEEDSFFFMTFCSLGSFLPALSSAREMLRAFPFSLEGEGLPSPFSVLSTHKFSLDSVFIRRFAVLLRVRGGGESVASLVEVTEDMLPILCRGVPETWEYREENALATVVSTSI